MAAKYGVHHTTIIRWKMAFENLHATKAFNPNATTPVIGVTQSFLTEEEKESIYSRAGYSKSYMGAARYRNHPGRESTIPEWAQVHLCRYFDLMREQNLPVSVKDLMHEYEVICGDETVGVPEAAV